MASSVATLVSKFCFHGGDEELNKIFKRVSFVSSTTQYAVYLIIYKAFEETRGNREVLYEKKKTMLFDDISFHDSVIFEVRENTFDQTIDFLLKFPTNWKENIFEKKILRFKNVVVYIKKEIPFSGYPTILDIRLKNTSKHSYNDSLTNVVVSEFKIEIITNAGNRFIEFSNVELINL